MEEVERTWLAARSAWPGIDVSAAEFAEFVASRTDSAKSTSEHPEATLRGEDLYLACACARGDGVAIAAFEEAFFPELNRIVAKSSGRAVPPVDEIRQMLRHKIFVAELAGRPKIAEYSGRGALRNWFRVTATRLVLNLSMRPSPEQPFDESLLMSLLGANIVRTLPSKDYLDTFRAAFQEAIARLSPRDLSLLRYAFGEELTVDAIGALHNVHRSTAARWVAKAHKALLDGVRSAAKERLGIDSAEYASALRDVYSQLDLSLERFLKPTERG